MRPTFRSGLMSTVSRPATIVAQRKPLGYRISVGKTLREPA
jgi:hypothetical protein